MTVKIKKYTTHNNGLLMVKPCAIPAMNNSKKPSPANIGRRLAILLPSFFIIVRPFIIKPIIRPKKKNGISNTSKIKIPATSTCMRSDLLVLVAANAQYRINKMAKNSPIVRNTPLLILRLSQI